MTSDMGTMQEVAGAELDRAILWHMVPHHGSAVVVPHRALPNLENAELRNLAQTTIPQTREMNAMLDMLGESSSPAGRPRHAGSGGDEPELGLGDRERSAALRARLE